MGGGGEKGQGEDCPDTKNQEGEKKLANGKGGKERKKWEKRKEMRKKEKGKD